MSRSTAKAEYLINVRNLEKKERLINLKKHEIWIFETGIKANALERRFKENKIFKKIVQRSKSNGKNSPKIVNWGVIKKGLTVKSRPADYRV